VTKRGQQNKDNGTTRTKGQWPREVEAQKGKGNKRNQTEVPKRQQMKMPNNVGKKRKTLALDGAKLESWT